MGGPAFPDHHVDKFPVVDAGFVVSYTGISSLAANKARWTGVYYVAYADASDYGHRRQYSAISHPV